jgi:PAS domain S-box-containing protein
VVDLETLRFVDVNKAAVEHYGYSHEEFLRMSVLEVRTPEAGEALQVALARPPHRPPEHDTCQHRKKSGEVIDVEVRSNEFALAGKRVWLASITDITERKRAEQALRRAVDFDEAVMTNMGEGLYTVDAEGLVTSMNPAAERLFGWKLEELLGKKMHDMTHYKHPDGRPYPAEECAGLQVLRGGKTLADHEDVFIRKDGTFFDVVYSSSPLWEGDNITGLVVVFRDVSERKRTEGALRKSEQRFTQFMRHLPALAWVKDSDGRYVFVNDAAERVFGKRRAELYGKTDQELFPPETADQFAKNDQQALASESGLQTIETLAHDDAIVHHSIVSKFPVPGQDGKEIMIGGVAFDITERKQAEEAQRELTDELAAELAATQQLQQTSTQLIREGNPNALINRFSKPQ